MALVCASLAYVRTSAGPPELDHLERVSRGVAASGWVPSRTEPNTDAIPIVNEFGDASDRAASPYPWPPGYDLVLTAAIRRALPDVGRLRAPASERPPPPPIPESGRAAVSSVVRAAPRWIRALIALVTAFSAAGLVTRARFAASSWAPAFSAAVAGAIVAIAPPALDHQSFAVLLFAILVGLVSRALGATRIDRPFWSAARGTLAGLTGGWMLITWTPSILGIALVEAALAWRLRSRAEGERARGLPVFATAFHKAALLVCLPAVIESPFAESRPFGVLDLSWFHAAWLGVGWLVFAPYAIAARSATRFPVAALVPALAAGAIVLASTGAAGELADAAVRATTSSVTARTLAILVVAPAAIALAAHASSGGTSALPWTAAAMGTSVVALLQPQLTLWAMPPIGVVAALGLARGSSAERWNSRVRGEKE